MAGGRHNSKGPEWNQDAAGKRQVCPGTGRWGDEDNGGHGSDQGGGFEFHSISQETEIKTTIPFTNASQRKKYLLINSTQGGE